MSDQGSTGGDIWVVNSNGKGNPTDITPGIDGTPTWDVWLNDHTLGFVEDRRGHTLLTDADADKHTVVPNSSDDLGEVNISGGGPIKNAVSGSNNGLIAYVQSSYNKPSEIYVGAPGKATQFTHLNDATQLHPPRFESIEWENEGFHVQGWLTFPKDYDPAKKYPLIVEVHGGPSASAGPAPRTPCGPSWATSSSCPTRAAPSARVKSSPPPTARTSATATSATSSRAWTPSRPNTPSTRTAKASPAGATAAS